MKGRAQSDGYVPYLGRAEDLSGKAVAYLEDPRQHLLGLSTLRLCSQGPITSSCCQSLQHPEIMFRISVSPQPPRLSQATASSPLGLNSETTFSKLPLTTRALAHPVSLLFVPFESI